MNAKPTLLPDDFLNHLARLTDSFSLKGKPSVNMNKSGRNGIVYSMSWNKVYSYTENGETYQTNSFMPHTFMGIMHSSPPLSRKHSNPLVFFNAYEAPWIKEANDLLAVCLKVSARDDTFLKLDFTHQRWSMQYKTGSVDIHSGVGSWSDFMKKAVQYALAQKELTFENFDNLSHFNKVFVLSVLHQTPIKTDETSQMFKAGLNMELESIATIKKGGLPKKM